MDRRAEILRVLGCQTSPWDVLVIGGGATGLGTAVEAASRGHRTLLVEGIDFAKGTSSRSTKLIHGGVRYLQQLDIHLVLDALRERGYMLRNAPHLVHQLSFVVPAYHYASLPYYGFGLTIYEWLSGGHPLGASKFLTSRRTAELLPNIVHKGILGGFLYQDGQFNDIRYAIALLRTLEDLGGTAINYLKVVGLLVRNGKTIGVEVEDTESGNRFSIESKIVINATGIHAEEILAMEGAPQAPILLRSQGTHFVLPDDFLGGNTAFVVPHTADGRVLFAIPWQGSTIVGTTDEPVACPSDEPRALEKEKRFLLEHIARYFGRRPSPSEIRSVWCGQRPLAFYGNSISSKISRSHRVIVSRTGLITVIGGKWTTYRRMGQDAVDRACEIAPLPFRASVTSSLKLHGWTEGSFVHASLWDQVYGSDLPMLEALGRDDSSLDQFLHARLPYRWREVIWAARYELARTVEDVLARRTNALFLDARAAIEAAPKVAALLARELNRSVAWTEADLASFVSNARGYIFDEHIA